jgi:hypothetical protein
MIHRKIALFSVLVSFTACQQGIAGAQIPQVAITGGLSVIGKFTVGKVLDDLESKAENIGSMANNDANLDFGNAYIALQSGLQGVVESLDNERSTIVNNLDDQRKFALLDVYVLANDMLANQIPLDMATMEVDTLTVLNHVNLLGKKTPFMIGYITPTVISYKDSGDYDVKVTGIGIGNQDGKQLPTTVTLMPSDSPPVTVPLTNIVNGVTFTIPRAMVAKRFNNSSLYRMGVKIGSTAPSPCGPVDLFTCERHYQFQYSMVLFPRIAVSGTVLQIRTTPSTDPSTRQGKTTSTTTANGNGNHSHAWATPVVTADPGYRIVKVELTSADNVQNKPGNPCAFVYINPGSVSPQNNGASAMVTGSNNSWPCGLTFTAWEEKITALSDTLPLSRSNSRRVNLRQQMS